MRHPKADVARTFCGHGAQPFEAQDLRVDRSPGLRFVGAKRFSQRLSASGLLLLRSSMLTVAGAAPDLHRLPLRHQVTFLYDEGDVGGRVWDREMTICWREIDCGLFAARCRRALRGVGRF